MVRTDDGPQGCGSGEPRTERTWLGPCGPGGCLGFTDRLAPSLDAVQVVAAGWTVVQSGGRGLRRIPGGG